MKKQIEEYYNGQETFIFVLIFFAVILLFLSVLGCIGTILASIMQRKEEFGIYVSMGFTKRKLARLILGELGCLFAAAFILAVAMWTGADRNGLKYRPQDEWADGRDGGMYYACLCGGECRYAGKTRRNVAAN